MRGFSKKVRQMGVAGVAVCAAKRIYYRILAARYRFPPWHASAPYECRPYKSEVVALANSCRPKAVLEIGCGLGEILSRVDAERRFGVDIDERVISAARFLHSGKCQFAAASFSDVGALKRLASGPVNLLIMVNWPHAIRWGELSPPIEAAIRALRIEYVLIDGIRPEAKGYANHHGRAEFESWGEITESVVSSDGARILYLVRCTTDLGLDASPRTGR